MQATLNTNYCIVDISRELITVRAVGKKKKTVLFDGRVGGRRFELTGRAIAVVAQSDGFDDSICESLRDLLAEDGAISREVAVKAVLNYY